MSAPWPDGGEEQLVRTFLNGDRQAALVLCVAVCELAKRRARWRAERLPSRPDWISGGTPLAHMRKIESFTEIVERERSILKLHDEVSDDTRKNYEDEFRKVFRDDEND